MKKRSLSLIVIITTITMLFTVNSAFAGSRHHERWKGVAIGLGAAIIGSAILNNSRDYSYRDSDYCEAAVRVPPRPRPHYKGHWEVRNEWVPPVYKTVWNPAHYNKRGDWIGGAWMKIEERPGYWKEERVWVAAHKSNQGRY